MFWDKLVLFFAYGASLAANNRVNHNLQGIMYNNDNQQFSVL